MILVIIRFMLRSDTSTLLKHPPHAEVLSEHTSNGYSTTLYKEGGNVAIPSSPYHLFVLHQHGFRKAVNLTIDDEPYQFLSTSPDAHILYIPPFLEHSLQIETKDEWIMLKIMDSDYCKILNLSESCVSKGAFLSRNQIRGVTPTAIAHLFNNLTSEPDLFETSAISLVDACFSRNPVTEFKTIPHQVINHDKITSYMWHNLEETISLEKLSSLAFLSKYHFLRCFKSLTGLSPLVFFRGMRIFKARYLLNTLSDTPCMAEIALECGFSDQAHLSRTFKKQTGLTPSHYRKIMQQQAKLH